MEIDSKEKKQKPKEKGRFKKWWKGLETPVKVGIIAVCLVVMIIILVLLGLEFGKTAVRKGTDAFTSSYKEEEKQVRDKTKEDFYNKGYQVGEKSNHVSNQVGISIENIKETAKLEVLEVRDVEFVFQGADENDKNITVWLEVPGTGVFTVNLQASEFIVDDKRNYVLVRVPEIELSECKVDYANVNKLRFENDIFDDSIAVGEDMAQEMLKDGYLLIQKEFLLNQWYYNSAEAAAENLIVNMIKEVNFGISDLQVEVEFMK